jgi:hypothetical protein
MQDKEDVPIQSQREAKLGLGMPSFQEVPMISTRTIPIEVDYVTIEVQEFHSPQQDSWKRRQK